MDAITKALTIEINANDLTGGAWGSVGAAIKELAMPVMALNQAWELTSKVAGAAWEAIQKPVAVLSEGGAYAEMAAGFASLAESYQVDGQRIVDRLREISAGEIGLQEATTLASNAIKQGFSADQAIAISTFAKKYSDTMGPLAGSIADISVKIERSLATGQLKALKEFGIVATEGESTIKVFEQMQARAAALGDGAFNFGESWNGAMQSVKDAGLELARSLNEWIGKMDVEGIASRFREDMRSLENEAPTIARGVFTPFVDGLEFAWRPFRDVLNEVDYWVGGMFDKADTLAIKVNTLILTVGNSFYDWIDMGMNAWNWVIEQVNAGLGAIVQKVTESVKLIRDALAPVMTANMAENFASSINVLEQFEKTPLGYFSTKFDEADWARKKQAFNDSVMQVRQLGEIQKENTRGLTQVGGEYYQAKQAEKQRKEDEQEAKKAAREWEKEVRDQKKEEEKAAKEAIEAEKKRKEALEKSAKAYTDMAKDAVKAMSSILEKEQEGINKTSETMGSFITSTFDPFSFSSGIKKEEMSRLMDRQMADKEKDRALLAAQADSNRELAKAIMSAADKPKKFEIAAPNSPNALEALVKTVIDTLYKEARLEGTPVQA